MWCLIFFCSSCFSGDHNNTFADIAIPIASCAGTWTEWVQGLCVWTTGRCSHTGTCACWILKRVFEWWNPYQRPRSTLCGGEARASQILTLLYMRLRYLVFLLILRCTFRHIWPKMRNVFRPVWPIDHLWVMQGYGNTSSSGGGGGLFFISEIHVFYCKISNTCSYFAKGNQDVELVMWNAAQVFYENS